MLTVFVLSYLYDSRWLEKQFGDYLVEFIGEPNEVLRGALISETGTIKSRIIPINYVYDWVQFPMFGKEVFLEEKKKSEILGMKRDFDLTVYYEPDAPSPFGTV